MRKIIIIMTVFCGFVMNSVNADDQILTKEQIEEKFNLPPEPDPELNNATIEGIDSNNNDIRDDWERAIAFEYYKDDTRMFLHNNLAKNNTSLNREYKYRNSSKYKEMEELETILVSCAYYFYSDGLGTANIEDKAVNTLERRIYILDRDIEISNTIGNGVDMLTKEQQKEICPKYKK